MNCYQFSLTRLSITVTSINYHLEARRNLQRQPIQYYHWLLTLLCQLQEHFYEIVDTNEHGDWNEHGKYCPVKASKVENKLPLDNMHMIRANNETVTKITSLDISNPTTKITRKSSNPLKNGQQKYCVGIAITFKT